MAKASPERNRKVKDRKPRVSETVYLRSDSRCTAMYLDRIYERDNVEYGYCYWKAYELQDDELIGKVQEKEFVLTDLTIVVQVMGG